jgi:phage protein D
MTLLRPAYRLTLGEQIVDTADEPKASTTVDLVVRLDMDTPSDGFTVVQGQVGGATPSPEDDATIELGYTDTDLEPVITGRVVDVVPSFETKRIVGLSNEDLLLRHHENETFEAMSAGNIVSELASRAGVDTDKIEDGINLPAFVVDGRRSVAAHIRDLAALCGYDTFVTPDGALVFEEFSGQRTAHPLRYGEHVLRVEVRRTRAAAGTVEVWGESPGSSRGTESWAWLTKDFETWHGSAGSGAPTMLLERSAVRTAEAAAASATRTQVGVSRGEITGSVRIQGRPSVLLGDLVRLEGFPLDDLDGNYQVRAVEHRISKAGGFVTDMGFRTVGSLEL